MRFVDNYGFTATIRWIVFGYYVSVRDSGGDRRHTRVYYRRGAAESAVKRYGSGWRRVRVFGRLDDETL